MMRIKVEFEVEVPDDAVGGVLDSSDLDDYIRYVFHDNGSLSMDNHFAEECDVLEPIFGTFYWEII